MSYESEYLNKNVEILKSIAGEGILHLERVSKHFGWDLESDWHGVEDLVLNVQGYFICCANPLF